MPKIRRKPTALQLLEQQSQREQRKALVDNVRLAHELVASTLHERQTLDNDFSNKQWAWQCMLKTYTRIKSSGDPEDIDDAKQAKQAAKQAMEQAQAKLASFSAEQASRRDNASSAEQALAAFDRKATQLVSPDLSPSPSRLRASSSTVSSASPYQSATTPIDFGDDTEDGE